MPGKDLQVLVIGELEGCASRYRRLLQQETDPSYRVVEALYSVDAHPTGHRLQLDGILLEATLSHFDGLAVLGQIQSQLGSACPPIIMIGEANISTALKAGRAGAADYLVREQLTTETLDLSLRTAIENAELKRELKYCEEQFQVSIENMLDCFGIFTALRDESGQIVDFRTGLTEAESFGLAGANALHPADRDRTLARWSQAIAEGEVFEIEHRIRRHDGTYRWFINRGIPTRDAQGQITGWIGTITDVEQQKRLEERLQLVLRAVDSLVYDWNLETNEIYRSEQLLTLAGYHPDEVPATAEWWFDQLHPEDRARLQAEAQALMTGSSDLLESECGVHQPMLCHWRNLGRHLSPEG